MRFFVFLVFATATPLFSVAQSYAVKEMMKEIYGQYEVDENGNVTYVDILENLNMSKEEIYDRAKSFFIYTYNDADAVIQEDDKDDGTLIGKGVFINVHHGYKIASVTYDSFHILRIDAKDNRCRIVLTLTDYHIRSVYDGAVNESDTPVSHFYPINVNAGNKTMTGKAFYNTHIQAQRLILSAADAVIYGNTSQNIDTDDW